jgi:hypothetical protein
MTATLNVFKIQQNFMGFPHRWRQNSVYFDEKIFYCILSCKDNLCSLCTSKERRTFWEASTPNLIYKYIHIFTEVYRGLPHFFQVNTSMVPIKVPSKLLYAFFCWEVLSLNLSHDIDRLRYFVIPLDPPEGLQPLSRQFFLCSCR